MVAPVRGLLKPKWRFHRPQDQESRRLAGERRSANWVFTHAVPGGVGLCSGAGRLLPGLSVSDRLVVLLDGAAATSASAAMACACSVNPAGGRASARCWGLSWRTRSRWFFWFPRRPVIVPATVLVAWLALGLARKWQSEPSWIDRAGRLMGVLWLATIPDLSHRLRLASSEMKENPESQAARSGSLAESCPTRTVALIRNVSIAAIGALHPACVHERTLCFKRMELLTNDLAETTAGLEEI